MDKKETNGQELIKGVKEAIDHLKGKKKLRETEMEIPELTDNELKGARKVTPEETKDFRKAIEDKRGTKRTSREKKDILDEAKGREPIWPIDDIVKWREELKIQKQNQALQTARDKQNAKD